MTKLPNAAMFGRMTNRPSGTASNDYVDALFAQIAGRNRRKIVTGKIRGQTGLPDKEADRPSVHLRWGLQQMRLRGWRADDWGDLLDRDGNIGTGPICILSSVTAPMDAPAKLSLETPEQFYLRAAFVALGRECPLYLSNWNDEQTDFEAIEEVVNQAIELAEGDEAVGAKPWAEASEDQLRALFGITPERIEAAQAAEKAEDAAAKG